MRIKPVPLTAELATTWAELGHQRFLEALMQHRRLQCNSIAFHGGTSLHLSWRSPRFSEDLDFLLDRETDIGASIVSVTERVRELFFADDPQFVIEMKDRTRDGDRMEAFMLQISHPAYLGKSSVKVEFWKVDKAYLEGYRTELRTPMKSGDMVSRVSNPVPAATLETAYCDKLTAFATRPFLKWRDIYDLWWIGTQTDARLDMEAVRRQFGHNVSAYATIDNLPPDQALLRFCELDKEAIIARADPDLRRWLPVPLWNALNPNGIREMVDYVHDALRAVATADNGRNLKRARP